MNQPMMVTMVFFGSAILILFGCLIIFYIKSLRIRRSQKFYDLKIRRLRTRAQQVENIHLLDERSKCTDFDRHQGDNMHNSDINLNCVSSIHDQKDQVAGNKIPRMRYRVRRNSHDGRYNITPFVFMGTKTSRASKRKEKIRDATSFHASPLHASPSSIKTEQETSAEIPINSTKSTAFTIAQVTTRKTNMISTISSETIASVAESEKLSLEKVAKYHEPTSHKPTSQDPTLQDLTLQDPTLQDPTSQDSTSQEPTSQEPTSQEPTSQKPTSQELSSEVPTFQEPTSQKPTSQEATSQEPTSQEPSSQEPLSQEPTSQDPVSQHLTSKDMTF